MAETKHLPRQFYKIRALVFSAVLVALVGGAAVANADQFDDQINALNAENSVVKGQVNTLAAQADSYEAAIGQLQAQISAVRAQIAANEARQISLQQQIIDAQAKLEQQRKFLGDNLRAMYIDGQLTTIEELATSSDLSEFVDKEEYRITVKDKINEMIAQITALQEQLKKQKAELETLIASQKEQNAQLASAEYEQQKLLAYNEGQQAAYNNQIKSNQSRINDLRKQQIAANARFSVGAPGTGATCGGGYPAKWCNIPMDSVIDSWGMYNRECVSYTAFKVWASGRYMPYWGGIGNANQWDDNARRAGIPVDTNPQAGDVAISNSGFYGHAMYVESVNPNGTINISQYNANWDGRYSERYNMSPAGLVFIHF